MWESTLQICTLQKVLWSISLQKTLISFIIPVPDQELESSTLMSMYFDKKSKHSSQMDMSFFLPNLHNECVDSVFEMNKAIARVNLYFF